MKVPIIALLALVLTIFPTGCSHQPPHDYSGAVAAAMQGRRQAYKDATTEIPRRGNSVFQVSLPAFVAGMRKLDVSDCPADFRAAWNDYLDVADKSARTGASFGYTALAGTAGVRRDGDIPLDYNGMDFNNVSGPLLDAADKYKPKQP